MSYKERKSVWRLVLVAILLAMWGMWRNDQKYELSDSFVFIEGRRVDGSFGSLTVIDKSTKHSMVFEHWMLHTDTGEYDCQFINGSKAEYLPCTVRDSQKQKAELH